MTKKQHTILNPIVERSENLAYIYFADLQEGGSSVNPCMLTKEELTQEDLFNALKPNTNSQPDEQMGVDRFLFHFL